MEIPGEHLTAGGALAYAVGTSAHSDKRPGRVVSRRAAIPPTKRTDRYRDSRAPDGLANGDRGWLVLGQLRGYRSSQAAIQVYHSLGVACAR